MSKKGGVCMETLLHHIHKCKDFEREIFASHCQPFNEHFDRWHNDLLPQKENNNFFAAIGAYDRSDIEAAIALQKSRGLDYLMIQSNEPMPEHLQKKFGFEEEQTLIMALLHEDSSTWKSNDKLEIRDIQTHDIREDVLDVSNVPEKYRESARRSMEMVLDVADKHPEYHWLYGYLNNEKIASVYILCHDGVIEMDDLWVCQEQRNQYFATTLMKYIAQHFEGTLYLHADASKTPKDMYARMGFETVAKTYEYYLNW